MSLFKEILQWLIEELIAWLEQWYRESRHVGAWQVVAVCANPNPIYNNAISYSYSALYPMSAGTRNFVINGQISGPGPYPSLTALPGGAQSAVQHQKGGGSFAQYKIGYQRRNYTIPYVPWFDVQNPAPNAPPLRPRNPAPRLRPYLKPDWRHGLDDRHEDPRNIWEPDAPQVADKPPLIREHIFGGPKQNYRPRVQARSRYARRNRNEKEKKFSGSSQFVQKFFRQISRFKEAVTEFDDLMDIFIDSMPKDIKKLLKGTNGRGATPDAKARFVYKHFDKVDWAKFSEEWVKNWIEDKAVGTAIAKSDKAAKARGETNTTGSRFWMHGASKAGSII